MCCLLVKGWSIHRRSIVPSNWLIIGVSIRLAGSRSFFDILLYSVKDHSEFFLKIHSGNLLSAAVHGFLDIYLLYFSFKRKLHATCYGHNVKLIYHYESLRIERIIIQFCTNDFSLSQILSLICQYLLSQ